MQENEKQLDLNILDTISYNLEHEIEKHNLKSNKNIYIFGTSTASYYVIHCLEQQGITIKGIIDNNEKKADTKYRDYYINTPESSLLPYQENAFIIIASSFYKEMCVQLEKMGYTQEKQIIRAIDFSAVLEQMITPDLPLISLQQQKSIQLDLLTEVHDICEKNNLTYYMIAGTLLGAVRHKGFIP